jgi:hypothetical protein
MTKPDRARGLRYNCRLHHLGLGRRHAGLAGHRSGRRSRRLGAGEEGDLPRHLMLDSTRDFRRKSETGSAYDVPRHL